MSKPIRDVYMNKMQQRIFFSNARHVRVLASRRFGKTDGVIAPRMYRVQQSMPQSTNIILGSSRAQLLKRTVPGMIAAIERFFHLREGRHFGFGRPPKWVPRPIITPRTWDSCLWFANGTIFQLISLSTVGSANGMTVNSIIADEVKFLAKSKIDGEIMPTLSGITHPFNDPAFSEYNPLYRSTLFVSDASLTAKGNWLEKEEDILDVELTEGPFAGKTYRWLQDKLGDYAEFCMWYNELARDAKRDGGRIIVLREEEIAAIKDKARRMMDHEGDFKILPRYGKRVNKAMCEMAVNYGLATPDEVELLLNHRYLITPEQYYRVMAIKGGKKHQDYVRALQRTARTFYRASTLDNLDLLGPEYIMEMKRSLPPVVFAISILNQKSVKINDGFYANLDIENVHGYTPETCPALQAAELVKTATNGGTDTETYNSYDFDRLSSVNDCTGDGDCADSLPLYVAMDYNANINWICTGQVYTVGMSGSGEIPDLTSVGSTEALHYLSSLFVKNEQMLQDLVHKWCRYYEPHRLKNNEVTYFYDSTAKQRGYAVTREDFKDVVIAIMEQHGWNVTPIDMGVPMAHDEKYKVLNEALAGLSYPAIRINVENNDAVIVALENAEVLKVGNSFKKYKAGEKLSETADGAVPYEFRTDGTDAFDSLYIGVKFHRDGGFGYAVMPRGRRRR